MRPDQCKLGRSEEHSALGISRETRTQGRRPGQAWRLGRDSGSSQTGQKVAPLGAAKKEEKRVLRLRDRG